MNPFTRELNRGWLALAFFTRIPVPKNLPFQPGELDRSARYFPLVGLLVGAATAGALFAGQTFVPLALAVLASMLFGILLTGAFHEDGLADSADGLGGGFDRPAILSIMKDSRIGTYGALALILALSVKFVALLALLETSLGAAIVALVLAHTLSRTSAVGVMGWLPYVRDDQQARAKPVAQGLQGPDLTIAMILGIAPLGFALLTGWCSWPVALGLILVCGMVVVLAGIYLRQRLGGYTGDLLGAVQQITEITVYVTLCALWL